MQTRSRTTVALAVAGVLLLAVGAGVALAQSRSPSPSPTAQTKTTAVGRDALLNDVAKRLGVPRSKLDAALKAQALADVKWQEDNGFITKDKADALRQRINSEDSTDDDDDGYGHGFPGGPGLGHGPGGFSGRFGHGDDSLSAAATYLGMSEEDLATALQSKTLARVAADQGKSLDGLKKALHDAQKSNLDQAVAAGMISQRQGTALLARFDANLDDMVKGVSPATTDLAKRLRVDRAKLITAVRAAQADQVDAALAAGDITKDQAEALKTRIRNGPGDLGGPGFCGGGPGGPAFGPDFYPGLGHGPGPGAGWDGGGRDGGGQTGTSTAAFVTY